MPAEIAGPADEEVLIAALTRVIERSAPHSLAVSDGVSERFFYFAVGGIRVIGSGPRRTASVAEILVDAGKATDEAMEQVHAAVKADGRPFADAAQALAGLSAADLDAAALGKVEDELLDLFLWDGAEIRLEEGQPPTTFYEGRFEAARVTCDVGAVLHAVLAKVEAWRGILGRLPELREVFESSNTALAEYRTGAKSRLVRHLDGSRSLADAMNRSGVRRSAAYQALLEMVRDSRVRRIPTSAAQKVTRDELAREIAALETALRTSLDPTVVRVRLARALEGIGESARAAVEWRFLGDFFRRDNLLARALECYRSAVRAVPTDFATRELILEIHRHTRDYGQLVSDGRPLAELFLKHNLLNRAKNLLTQLVGLEAQDTGLRRQLIMVLIGLGERELALKHLRDLSKILEQRKAPEAEMRDVFMRILALDKKDRHAQDRLDTITGVKFQRRVLRATIGATAGVLVALCAWFAYEGAARREVNLAVATARKEIERSDFAAAKATLRNAAGAYSYAKASGTAAEVAQEIERYEQRERERIGEGAESQRTSAQRDEAAARALVQRAIEQSDAGKDDEAYRTYRELFEVFGDVALVESVSLPLKISVLPLDARVRLAGQEVGQGALTLRYSPRAKCTLLVEREGYTTFKKVLDGPQEAKLDVSLEKPTRWTFVSDAAIDAPPLVAHGLVFVAGRDRCLTAMSTADGAVQWRTPLGLYGDVSVRPVLTDAGVVVTTASGDAVCVDASTGAVVWRTGVGAPVDRQPVAVSAGAVVVAANDGSLRSIAAANGDTAWSLPAGACAAAPALVEDDQLAYVDPKGALVFASATTGAPLPGYTQPAPLRGTPVVDDGRLWVRADDGSLCVIATASRRSLRRCAVPAPSDLAPAVSGTAVYATSSDGSVYAFHTSGEAMLRVRLDEPASAPPVVSKGRLYVPGQKGRMYVLDAGTGALLWRFDAKSRITSTPVVDAGTIYVTTASGRLIAIEE